MLEAHMTLEVHLVDVRAVQEAHSVFRAAGEVVCQRIAIRVHSRRRCAGNTVCTRVLRCEGLPCDDKLHKAAVTLEIGRPHARFFMF